MTLEPANQERITSRPLHLLVNRASNLINVAFIQQETPIFACFDALLEQLRHNGVAFVQEQH
jgi:hypothetical protein